MIYLLHDHVLALSEVLSLTLDDRLQELEVLHVQPVRLYTTGEAVSLERFEDLVLRKLVFVVVEKVK